MHKTMIEKIINWPIELSRAAVKLTLLFPPLHSAPAQLSRTQTITGLSLTVHNCKTDPIVIDMLD